MRPFLDPGMASAVGSLPHVDPEIAAAAALSLQPGLPAAPQLPRRHVAEGMLAQVTAGCYGVRARPDGSRLEVDRRRLAAPAVDEPLDDEAWAATKTFLRVARAAGHVGPIKLQIAGPVTLGLALVEAGVKAAKAFPVAGAIVSSRVRALRREARVFLPASPVLLVLDEPGLTGYSGVSFPIGTEDTIDLLSGALAAAGRDAMAGVHCCGPTDWRLIFQAGPDLVSLPVDESIGDHAGALSMFIDRGGWVAWGAVPTDRPLGESDSAHWRRLNSLWSDLARNGCDPLRLRAQAIVTPACGLAFHGEVQIPRVYGLVGHLAERVQDEALAARLSAGA